MRRSTLCLARPAVLPPSTAGGEQRIASLRPLLKSATSRAAPSVSHTVARAVRRERTLAFWQHEDVSRALTVLAKAWTSAEVAAATSAAAAPAPLPAPVVAAARRLLRECEERCLQLGAAQVSATLQAAVSLRPVASDACRTLLPALVRQARRPDVSGAYDAVRIADVAQAAVALLAGDDDGSGSQLDLNSLLRDVCAGTVLASQSLQRHLQQEHRALANYVFALGVHARRCASTADAALFLSAAAVCVRGSKGRFSAKHGARLLVGLLRLSRAAAQPPDAELWALLCSVRRIDVRDPHCRPRDLARIVHAVTSAADDGVAAAPAFLSAAADAAKRRLGGGLAVGDAEARSVAALVVWSLASARVPPPPPLLAATATAATVEGYALREVMQAAQTASWVDGAAVPEFVDALVARATELVGCGEGGVREEGVVSEAETEEPKDAARRRSLCEIVAMESASQTGDGDTDTLQLDDLLATPLGGEAHGAEAVAVSGDAAEAAVQDAGVGLPNPAQVLISAELTEPLACLAIHDAAWPDKLLAASVADLRHARNEAARQQQQRRRERRGQPPATRCNEGGSPRTAAAAPAAAELAAPLSPEDVRHLPAVLYALTTAAAKGTKVSGPGLPRSSEALLELMNRAARVLRAAPSSDVTASAASLAIQAFAKAGFTDESSAVIEAMLKQTFFAEGIRSGTVRLADASRTVTALATCRAGLSAAEAKAYAAFATRNLAEFDELLPVMISMHKARVVDAALNSAVRSLLLTPASQAAFASMNQTTQATVFSLQNLCNIETPFP